MRTIWRRAPMLRLSLPFLAGMFLYSNLDARYALFGCLLVLSILLIVLGRWKYKSHFHQRHWLGCGVLLFFVVTGALRLHIYYSTDTQLIHLDQGQTYLVQLVDEPIKRNNSFRCIAKVLKAADDSSDCFWDLPVLVYFQKSEGVAELEQEDILMIQGKAQIIQKPNAPGELDMQSHYKKKGIKFQLYADSLHWQFLTKLNDHSLRYYMNSWRDKALAILTDYGIQGDEYSVLAALILGDTSDMDKELLTSYSAAGVVHVLAVSGLHVGLVYVLLAPLFKRIFGRSKGKWLRTILPISILWIYSLLTGGSPSVLRAAVMFSGFIFAENFGKNNNIYNTLAASAFVLLMVRPSMLFELGFQLSYLAVIGIVILQRPIYLLVTVKNKWLDKLWTMTAVSIAAQIVTLPITLYYFHQFPNYFLASNLFIIPWSTLIIYVSILFYFTTPLPNLAYAISKLMIWMTKCMNAVIVWFDHLPGSLTTQIGCTGIQFWCWCAGLFFGLRWLFWRRTPSLIMFQFVLVVAICNSFYSTYKRSKQDVAMLHCGRKEWFVSHVLADSMAIYKPSQFQLEETSYGFEHYQRETGVLNRLDTVTCSQQHLPFFLIQETLIYAADSSSILRYGIPQANIIMLYDLGKLRLNKEHLMRLRNCQVVCATNVSRRKMKWIKSQLHDSVELIRMAKGAFVLQNMRWQPYSEVLF